MLVTVQPCEDLGSKKALKACFHKDIFADFMAFAEQMALRSFSFEVTAWTRAGCFLIPRCIALHLWSGLFTKFVVLFSTWSITWSHGLGCLDIQLNNQSFLFNMRFSRYVSDWHFYQSFANSNLLNSQITGKNQLYGTALPCWLRLTRSFRFRITGFAFI